MALSIRNPETERLARRLARRRKQTITEAITVALREELKRERDEETPAAREAKALAEELLAIGRDYAALPVKDTRAPDEILGYDERGLFSINRYLKRPRGP